MIREIEKGKIGGWRPNSGRKPGFRGYWKGKKRPDMIGNKYKKPEYGKDNPMNRLGIGLKMRKENHPNWKGGSWLYWKTQRLIKDGYTCQKCFLYDPEVMTVDHIIPNSKTGKKLKDNIHDINNLQTLCANCHLKKTKSEKREGAHTMNYYSIQKWSQ